MHSDRLMHDAGEAFWYAIYTRHQHEKSVATNLTGKGFKVFLPLCETAHRWKDRTRLILLPLFPCYVFLNGGLDRRMDLITTPGINALVSHAGQPARIPSCEIGAILRAVESGVPVEPHAFLKCGQRVRVRSGPLQGVEGMLVRKRSSIRLVLSVEMLGKAVAVEVDAGTIESLNVDRLPYSAKRMDFSPLSARSDGDRSLGRF
jgi:transcription antitermination factor NusG